MYTARGHAPPTDEDKFGSTPNAVGRAAWPFEDERARLGWARNDESKDATGSKRDDTSDDDDSTPGAGAKPWRTRHSAKREDAEARHFQRAEEDPAPEVVIRVSDADLAARLAEQTWGASSSRDGSLELPLRIRVSYVHTEDGGRQREFTADFDAYDYDGRSCLDHLVRFVSILAEQHRSDISRFEITDVQEITAGGSAGELQSLEGSSPGYTTTRSLTPDVAESKADSPTPTHIDDVSDIKSEDPDGDHVDVRDYPSPLITGRSISREAWHVDDCDEGDALPAAAASRSSSRDAPPAAAALRSSSQDGPDDEGGDEDAASTSSGAELRCLGCWCSLEPWQGQIFACCMNRACRVCLRRLADTSAPGAARALVAHCPMCRAPTDVPFEVSVERLLAGAERGDSEAQRMLGDLFKRGDGVPRDETQALHLFRLAAEQGNPCAQTDLGVMYRHGCGVPADVAVAEEWFSLAARRGFPIAMYNLARIKEADGEAAEAARLYSNASKAGDAPSASRLGELHLRGLGVARDRDEAERFFALAGELEANASEAWQQQRRPTQGRLRSRIGRVFFNRAVGE